MKKLQTVKTIAVILLLISLFCTVDLGLNLAFNAETAVHDNSYGTYSILHGLFGIFGDSLWSFDRFFNAFSTSAWLTFALLVANVVLRFLKQKGN